MSENKHKSLGRTDKQGQLLIIQRGALLEFLKNNTDRRIMLTAEVYEPGTTNGLRAYFYGVVLPICQKGLRRLGYSMNQRETEKILKRQSPIMIEETWDPETCQCKVQLRSLSDLSSDELRWYIEDLQRWAAEDLNIYIPDPNEEII